MSTLDDARRESARRADEAALLEPLRRVQTELKELQNEWHTGAMQLEALRRWAADVQRIANAAEARRQARSAGGVVGATGPDGNAVSGLPIATGTVVYCLQSATPEGWLACDGTERRIADFPELYAVIGGQFGTANEACFKLPAASDLGGAIATSGQWLIRT